MHHSSFECNLRRSSREMNDVSTTSPLSEEITATDTQRTNLLYRAKTACTYARLSGVCNECQRRCCNRADQIQARQRHYKSVEARLKQHQRISCPHGSIFTGGKENQNLWNSNKLKFSPNSCDRWAIGIIGKSQRLYLNATSMYFTLSDKFVNLWLSSKQQPFGSLSNASEVLDTVANVSC